jgi:O-antigen ligase
VIPAAALLILALVLSLTRNTLVGAIAGVFVVVLMRRPRAIPFLLAIILAFYFLSPAKFKQRLQSVLNPADPNTRNRIELFQTSMRLIHDNPWLGVGPKNVKYAALKYRGQNEYPDWMYQHMHNNFLQIAAEMGIPGLLIWLWFMIRLAWDALRIYRRANNLSLPIEGGFRMEALTASAAALGSWVALLVAGIGEYNFGDSEVLTLFLFIMSAPYAFMAPPLSIRENAPPNGKSD